MNKEFIKYEEALAMKELGFDEECAGCYEDDNMELLSIGVIDKTSSFTGGVFGAPLYQQAFRWFREEYDWINPTRQLVFILDKTAQSDNPMSYEEAESACLRKLIEIVTKNKYYVNS